MDGDALLRVKDLRTYFHTRQGPIKAVDGISYDIQPGELVAVVGESGCGKTVGALSILRLLPVPPAEIVGGVALFGGRDLLRIGREELRRVRGKEISMVFQEPMSSLNPVLTIGRQLVEGMREHLHLTDADAKREAIRLLDIVGVSDAARRFGQYPHQYSGGMRQRLMLAMALSCKPKLIIADEPTTAVDVTLQAQILELLDSLRRDMQLAVLLITHNLGVVAKYAHRVNIMYAGRIVETGTVDAIFAKPGHPYTKALLNAVPRLDRGRHARLVPIQGEPPNLLQRPGGCAFHVRCHLAESRCRQEWPLLTVIADGHASACPALSGG